jgi:hypothetical protein
MSGLTTIAIIILKKSYRVHIIIYWRISVFEVEEEQQSSKFVGEITHAQLLVVVLFVRSQYIFDQRIIFPYCYCISASKII